MVSHRFIGLANELADAVRPIAARYFRTQVAIDDKSDSSPVTIADREAETAMRTILAREVPQHGAPGDPETDDEQAQGGVDQALRRPMLPNPLVRGRAARCDRDDADERDDRSADRRRPPARPACPRRVSVHGQ